MFATSHLWCSLPWWIHCPLACSVAKESQRSFHLCGERFSFVEDNEKFVYQKAANFCNVSPFSSTSRGNRHIFRAYPPTLKIAELCFETTAAHFTIIWSGRLSFLPLPEAGTGFVSVLPLPSTHFWSSRKHYIVHGTTLKTAFAILSRNQSPDVSNVQRGRSCQNELIIWKTDGRFFFLSPHLPYVFGHVRLL